MFPKSQFYIKLSSFSLFLLLFVACEEVVDIDLQQTDSRLVIEAAFLVTSDDSFLAQGAVKLSQSSAYYEMAFPKVSNATIQLFTANNEVAPLVSFIEDQQELGTYLPDMPFEVSRDSTYTLQVTTKEGKSYKAISSVLPSMPIDTIIQGERTFFNEEKEVVVTATDPFLGQENFYLFRASTTYPDDDRKPLLGVDKDEYSDGQQRDFSIFYSEIEEPTEALIEIIGMDEQYYNYMSLLIEQNGQQQRSPFEAIPATVIGNFVNTQDHTDVPLGYFSVSERYIASVLIDPEL